MILHRSVVHWDNCILTSNNLDGCIIKGTNFWKLNKSADAIIKESHWKTSISQVSTAVWK